jgi:hypothetical protein
MAINNLEIKKVSFPGISVWRLIIRTYTGETKLNVPLVTEVQIFWNYWSRKDKLSRNLMKESL